MEEREQDEVCRPESQLTVVAVDPGRKMLWVVGSHKGRETDLKESVKEAAGKNWRDPSSFSRSWRRWEKADWAFLNCVLKECLISYDRLM